MTDDQVRDETGEEGGQGAGAGATPEEQLDHLQQDLDEVRRRAEDDVVDQGDHRFIQEGEASRDEPVDDTIVPPG
ncbi:MAG: hypothetical protein ACLGIO_07615 [Acidimicrobiia bacterium]